MGRWVTSKGRRIYIPDEGEENPFAKNKTGVTRKDVEELTSKRDKVKNANLKTTSITNEEIVQNKKDWDKLKNQINKDFDLKEKQIADNKKQTQFGADMNTKISDYQNKFLKKKSDKELDEIESNLKKSTSLVGTSVNDQVAFAAIENERKSRKGKKK